MSDFSYELVEKFGTFADNNGWTKEVNLIKYGSGTPKLDIRNWSETEDGERKMAKGITLNKKEAIALKDLLNKLDIETLEF